MIIVSRLNGQRFGVNADHIERIEEMPDTVLTLADGTKYIVQESLDEVLDKIVGYRSEILRISYAPAGAKQAAPEVSLHLVDDGSNSADEFPSDRLPKGDH